MTNRPDSMSCEEFQAQLAELIGTGADISKHPHLRACEFCPALLADLETIAEAARQLFPIVEPPDEVWDNIELALRHQGNSSSAVK